MNKLIEQKSAVVVVSPKGEKLKLKTRLVAGDTMLPKLATNHNSPIKADPKPEKKLKLKTRLVAGDSFLPKISATHNAPVKVEPKTEKKQLKLKTRLVAGDSFLP